MNKYKRANFKIYVQQENTWINVLEKKTIIYGVGQGFFDMLKTLQFPNIYKIIDGNEKIQGKNILVQNKLFQIEAPTILKSIDSKECYVVISSILYKEEILDNIHKITDGTMIVGVWNTDIYYSYDTLEDMLFLDPIVKSKLVRCGLSFDIYHIIHIFYKLCEVYFYQIKLDKFISIQKGFGKLVFLFGNEKNLWVFSIVAKFTSWNVLEIQKSEEGLLKKKICFLKNHNLDNEITLYRDENGILIQNYAFNHMDFEDWEIRKQVMQECRRIHKIETIGLEENHIIEGVYEYPRSQILNKNKEHWTIIKRVDEIMEQSIQLLKGSKYKTLIHCDLNCGNIVNFNGKIIFIDWEYLSIGNPMFDVGLFLYDIHFNACAKPKVSFRKRCEDCFSEVSQLVMEYCEKELEFSDYIEYARAVLKIYIVGMLFNTYFIDEKKGIQQILEFIQLLREWEL